MVVDKLKLLLKSKRSSRRATCVMLLASTRVTSSARPARFFPVKSKRRYHEDLCEDDVGCNHDHRLGFCTTRPGASAVRNIVGSQYDTVNLANLSIQVNATLRAKPGLMSLSYEFGVDDFVGFPGGTSSSGPGPMFIMGTSGTLGMGVYPTSPPVNGGECPGPADVYWYTYNRFLLDGAGNFHSVPLNVTISNGFNGNSGCNATTASAYATDGSGYNFEIVGSTGTAIITDVDGNSQSSIVAYDGYISPVATINYSYWSNMHVCTDGYCSAEVATVTDANGNSMSSTITNVDNFEYQQVFKDSLGQTALPQLVTPSKVVQTVTLQLL